MLSFPQYSCLSWSNRLLVLTLLVCATNLPVPRGSEAAEIETHHADIVIYGGTSAAITAAVQAKKMGKSVIVVSPDQHLGGLTSSGLGWTDTGNKAVIGGLARDFYHRVWKHYQSESAWKWQSPESYGGKGQGTPAVDGEMRTMWIFEPNVAEKVFEQVVREYDIPVLRDQWLDRESGVTMEGAHLKSFRTLSGDEYEAQMFLDATYEGDLMAAAGVDYHVGRESRATYNEQWNGVQTGVLHHSHHFGVLDRPVDPYVVPGDPASGVIPRVSADPPGEYGSADDKIQAYCFRMCLTDHPENRVPFRKPEGYDAREYELMARVFEAGWKGVFRKFDPIPNRKTDTNNHGPMSTDNIGFNYAYPEASYEKRREIITEHERYQKGWLYFVATDPRVPPEIQAEMNGWGLAADEFVDNGHWPHQIYVREARRLIGSFVMTENHLLKREPTPDSVGMGSYTMDSHNVQRYITSEGHVQNEGDIGVSTRGPYQIAYGSLTPKSSQCTNLLVPVCVSSSHIAFGSIRMEPVFMILGQSAATAAALAIDRNETVQDLPYEVLRRRLLDDGQVLAAPPGVAPAPKAGIEPEDLEGIVIDDAQANLDGPWVPSTATASWVADHYFHDGNSGKGEATAEFKSTVPESGTYEVRLYYSAHGNRATDVPVSISHTAGTTRVRVNQREEPRKEGRYTSLGSFRFDAGEEAIVIVSNRDTDGHVIVDAVSFVLLADD